ncbi:transmembrane signal receptor [Lithospermum erythrorhizon]|uniref:Transmembrane signal receptor n=1 Tax=Lithospermum erythrorhizon TaxID=34254 RepID=A0AAV3NX96_LITER
MKAELSGLEQIHTWELIQLPSEKKPIDCRWIYKVKCKSDGTVDKFKARLVAKNYNQVEGVDFFESFSHVAKTVTVRLLLVLDVANYWHLHQLDVNNAFLHGFLDEEVYMQVPEGYVKAEPGQVCKLTRSLYGLKKASR